MTTTHDAQTELQALTARLSQADFAYYVLNDPVMPDQEYDELEKQYQSVSGGKGWVRKEYDGQKIRPVAHTYFMGSVNRTYDLSDIEKFVKKCKDKSYRITRKIDGIAFSAYYELGFLVRVLTRGKGTHGEDITDIIKFRQALPLYLKNSLTLVVKGELYVRNSTFMNANQEREAQGKKVYATPRHLASSLAQHMAENYKLEAIVFRRFDPHTTDKVSEMLNLSSQGFHTEISIGGNPHYTDADKVISVIEEADRCVNRINNVSVWNDIPVDGLIIEVASKGLESVHAGTLYKPGWMLAYKFDSLKANAKIYDVRYDVTDKGELVPKAVFNPPVLLGNFECKELTLYNAAIQEEHNYYTGKLVTISLTGDVVLTIKPYRGPGSYPVEQTMPETCPYCGSSVERIARVYQCLNRRQCEGALAQRIYHFFSPRGVRLKGLGLERIKLLGLRQPADLFSFDHVSLSAALASEKQAESLIKQFDLIKGSALQDIILGLAVPGVGRTMVRTRLDESFRVAKANRLEELKGLKSVGFTALKDEEL